MSSVQFFRATCVLINSALKCHSSFNPIAAAILQLLLSQPPPTPRPPVDKSFVERRTMASLAASNWGDLDENDCEDFFYKDRYKNYDIKEDKASMGLGAICGRANQNNERIYLSGQGADEIISDYGFNETKYTTIVLSVDYFQKTLMIYFLGIVFTTEHKYNI